MAVEMAIWRMTDDGPHPLVSSPLDSEQRLEDMIAEDPRMSGTDLLIIGRQVPTGFGGFIDLLALDAEGRVHVLELKRDRHSSRRRRPGARLRVLGGGSEPRGPGADLPRLTPSSSATSPTAATSTWLGRGYSIPARSRTRRLDRRAARFARGTAGTSA